LIGGALLAIGLLSLLDLHFFKTPLRGKLALAVGLAFMVATQVMFATSSAGGRYFEGQKALLTDCEYKVERDYPAERRDNPKLIGEKITACMSDMGYEWAVSHAHCAEAPIATNVFCYLPSGTMERRIVAFQMGFE